MISTIGSGRERSGGDLVRAHYAASARGDLAAMIADFARDISWTEMVGSPYAGTYVGVDEVVAGVFGPIGDDWSSFEASPDDFVEAADSVVALGRYRGVHATTGRRVDARFAHVWQVRGGRLQTFEQFTDTALFDHALRGN